MLMELGTMFLLKGNMKNLFVSSVFGLLCVGALASCSSTSTVYHWSSRNDVGPQKFVVDHNACMREADYWPFDISLYDSLDFISPGPHDPKHRLDSSSDRTWASFIPYPGAQAVYVNDVNSSSTIDADDYASCMESLGYVQGFPEEERVHLINDRSMGYRGDYF